MTACSFPPQLRQTSALFLHENLCSKSGHKSTIEYCVDYTQNLRNKFQQNSSLNLTVEITKNLRLKTFRKKCTQNCTQKLSYRSNRKSTSFLYARRYPKTTSLFYFKRMHRKFCVTSAIQNAMVAK